MTIKQYNAARVITAMCLAAVMSQAVVLKNYYLAGSAILFAMLLLIYLKKQLKEITADERDYKIAGDAARWTLTILALLELWFLLPYSPLVPIILYLKLQAQLFLMLFVYCLLLTV